MTSFSPGCLIGSQQIFFFLRYWNQEHDDSSIHHTHTHTHTHTHCLRQHWSKPRGTIRPTIVLRLIHNHSESNNRHFTSMNEWIPFNWRSRRSEVSRRCCEADTHLVFCWSGLRSGGPACCPGRLDRRICAQCLTSVGRTTWFPRLLWSVSSHLHLHLFCPLKWALFSTDRPLHAHMQQLFPRVITARLCSVCLSCFIVRRKHSTHSGWRLSENKGGCSEAEPASCCRTVAGLIPLVCMSKCPWARYWTPNCFWCAGRQLARQPPPSVCECMNYCKTLWTEESDKCPTV